MSQTNVPRREGLWEKIRGWLWVPVIFLNIALVVLIQVLFFHTIPGPLTADKIVDDPYFEGCTFISMSAEQLDGPIGTGRCGYVLFEDPQGQRKMTRYDCNRVFNRWGRAPFSTRKVEGDTVNMFSFLGYDQISIRESGGLGMIRPFFWPRSQKTSMYELVISGLILQGLEAWGLHLLRKRRASAVARAASHQNTSHASGAATPGTDASK